MDNFLKLLNPSVCKNSGYLLHADII